MIRWFRLFLCEALGHKWGELQISPYTSFTHWQACERCQAIRNLYL